MKGICDDGQVIAVLTASQLLDQILFRLEDLLREVLSCDELMESLKSMVISLTFMKKFPKRHTGS